MAGSALLSVTAHPSHQSNHPDQGRSHRPVKSIPAAWAPHHLVKIHPTLLKRKGEIVAMAGSTIHLKIHETIAELRQSHLQPAFGIDAPELFPWSSISLKQPDHSAFNGFPSGEAARQFKLSIEIAQAAFHAMGFSLR
tara:strand:+ start:886 stop:1299 length:414 start_codon:yes stop_codon:yes gene_type:complete